MANTELITSVYTRIKENIGKVIVGKNETIDMICVALLAGGHVLLEDVPGTGKTVLIKSLAASVGCDFKRIQFTPDLLPSDITGINFFNMKSSEFEFVPGPVFTNILLADEINRATPKTQSGLLECMEERQATIDGKTMRLSDPFMVIATQNPVETLGTFPLPEAQLDRFLMRISLGYPEKDAEKMCSAEQLHREGKLPKRICHCDTKVSNMMFDMEGKVLCVIDLDTIMPSFIFSDFGDFLRSAANTGKEDDADLNNVQFNMEIFKAFAKGYIESAKVFLTPLEIEMLPYAAQLFPYMQAVRFLADYINGDTYYQTKYADHNLVRTKAQYKLYQEACKAEAAMKEFITELI